MKKNIKEVVIWRKGVNDWFIFPLGYPLNSLKVCATSGEARAFCEHMGWKIHTDASKGEHLNYLDEY
jgi:hypothetical protein